MSTPLLVPTGVLDGLAAGRDDAPALALLRAGHLSRNLLLVRMVLDAVPPADPWAVDLDHGYRLLTSAQAVDATAVSALLTHPQVGAWAMGCLRRLRAGEAPPPELAYLPALAAVAAERAGLEFTLDIPLHDGTLLLPTRGLVSFAMAESRARVHAGAAGLVVTAEGAVVRVPDRRADAEGWQVTRVLVAESHGARISLEVDDHGPFRAQHDLPLAPRLTPERIAGWRRTLASGWRLLARHHTATAQAMAGTYRALVPLEDGGRQRSATNAESFGALAATRPPDATACAATLVHEFQHTKLAGLSYLLPLCENDPDVVFYSPWRTDPRPAGALLHGIYAHFGLAGFWRVHRHVARRPAETRAQYEFALRREQTRLATRLLRRSPVLTAHGERFVDGISSTVDEWFGERVPADVTRRVAVAMAAHRDGGYSVRHQEDSIGSLRGGPEER